MRGRVAAELYHLNMATFSMGVFNRERKRFSTFSSGSDSCIHTVVGTVHTAFLLRTTPISALMLIVFNMIRIVTRDC